jgi:hypothetical protein
VIDNRTASGAVFDEVYWDGRDRLAAMKRTVTVTFELTRSQTNKIKLLGSMLWPSQNLPYPEVCRRVLLEGADRMRGSKDDRLLEEVCQPSQTPSKIENSNPFLMAT